MWLKFLNRSIDYGSFRNFQELVWIDLWRVLINVNPKDSGHEVWVLDKIDGLQLTYLHFRCPNLEVLSIKSCANVTDRSMAKIALGCQKLQEVDISYCHEISNVSLSLIGKHCPNIKTLKRNFFNTLDPSQQKGIVPDSYLSACPQDVDSEAVAIAKFMPNLEHLELCFSKLSAKALTLICKGCPNLKYLDLFGCVNLTSRDIVNATSSLENLEIRKPNFYIPRSVFHTERYGHWRLYDERFQTDIFRIWWRLQSNAGLILS